MILKIFLVLNKDTLHFYVLKAKRFYSLNDKCANAFFYVTIINNNNNNSFYSYVHKN